MSEYVGRVGDEAGVERAPGSVVPVTMRAVVRHEYGTADVLVVDEVPVPRPGRGEVLVRVDAAGLDRGAWHLMAGDPPAVRLALGLRRPRDPGVGSELAGVVVAIGPGDRSGLRIGDVVLGAGLATFAEYAIAKTTALCRRPSDLDAVAAAALPVSAVTAHQAVVDIARVTDGQRVLVIGAAGGVGAYAVQFAASCGAVVTAVSRRDKHAAVRDLGASAVVDRERVDPRDWGVHDVVIDIGGRRPLAQLGRLVARAGALVLVGGEGGRGPLGGTSRQVGAALRSPFLPFRARMFVSTVTTRALAPVVEAVADGRVRPVVDRVVGLGDVASGVSALEAGSLVGKVVVVPDAPTETA
ncbi:NADPH:quinone reductase-like Zn-dependent oxidoreductase [Pseudoclavibacter chungangensis]|nr:zinc-binding dehydrogenase [Pseudoclavibacter chungangensis]NYJ65297.1 NADPH:quinone reductase-like Zn-dependent oxidoreductase [Pseudoclavibacter chungangensis]